VNSVEVGVCPEEEQKVGIGKCAVRWSVEGAVVLLLFFIQQLNMPERALILQQEDTVSLDPRIQG
jgi:hypothetical protein